jgi:hypothetical protein
MAGVVVAGLRGTGDWGTDERPKNFRETILWRSPNGKAPLTALLAKMKSESVDDPEFNWWEEELNVVRLTMANGTAYGTTIETIVVTSNYDNDAQVCVAGDVFMYDAVIDSSFANEILVVSSVTDATTVVFKRAQAGTSRVASIAVGGTFTKIGNVYGEGTGAPTASTRNPTKFYNYCQIFKTTYEITETAKRTKTRTGDALKIDKKRKMFDHSVALEFAFLLGKRYEGTGANGKPLRFTGGILEQMKNAASSRITKFATTPTETTFTNALYSVFDYDTGAGDERIVFAGNGALNSLNRLAASQSRVRINYDGIVESFGMKLQRWVLPQGVLYIKSHPLFNTHSQLTNDMLVLDPTALRYRHMRDTTFKDNIQDNDADSQKGQWLTEAGLEMNHGKTSAWLSNFIVP